MKFYKLHINDNGHRFGFTFTNYDSLKQRLGRIMEKAQELSKEMKEMRTAENGNEYLMELTF